MPVTLLSAIEAAAPEIIAELEKLILPILGSPDPLGAIAKAARNAEMDALDYASDTATDAALNTALKKAHS